MPTDRSMGLLEIMPEDVDIKIVFDDISIRVRLYIDSPLEEPVERRCWRMVSILRVFNVPSIGFLLETLTP